MDTALETLSKEQLITLLQKKEATIETHQKVNSVLKEENTYLKHRVDLLERLQFGQKRERFEADPRQGVLPFETPVEEEAQQQEEIKEEITYTRKKQSAHKGRAALPDHLPVEEIENHPEGDLTQMVCIGKEVTEELECEPARFFIRRYIRYKYAAKNGKDFEGIKTGDLPERVIDKGIPGPGLLSMILTDKYQDHLPLYRQKQRLARENIPIASSSIEGWVKQGLERIEPLWQQLRFDIKAKGYLQVDETTIKVLESDKKGAAHLGWYWVYHSPLDGLVLMDYQSTRGAVATKNMLGSFKGYLQTDGYGYIR